MSTAMLQDIIIGSPSHESVRRNFRCARGHQYTADRPVTIRAYGITASYEICPACFVSLIVELCGCEEIKPAPPPIPIAAVITPPVISGPATVPMSMNQLMAARRRAQGLPEEVKPVATATNPVPVPAETANLAPETVPTNPDDEDMPNLEQLRELEDKTDVLKPR